MKIKVKFFEDDFIEAINGGVYEIYLKEGDNKEELLYIGESVFVLVRCATHLFEISKGIGYLGFDEKNIEDDNVTLIFKLYKSENDKRKRKEIELKLIEQRGTALQSGLKDWVKPVDEMIEKVAELINRRA